MGARVVCGRSYPAEEEPNNTGPWVASSSGVMVRMPARWTALSVVEWLKLHFTEALLINVTEDDQTLFSWRFKGMTDPTMAEFVDRISRITYGRSRAVSIREGICVACGGSVIPQESAMYQEYLISGLCAKDQVKVFGP